MKNKNPTCFENRYGNSLVRGGIEVNFQAQDHLHIFLGLAFSFVLVYRNNYRIIIE